MPASHLIVGLQCGGSDGYSGVTANPALGVASDLLVRHGGTAILGETPEIYGAEHLLTRRAVSREVGEKLIDRIEWWEEYTRSNGDEINNNPSPGNKAGGLTTIIEKSLGAMAKAGSTNLGRRMSMREPVTRKGFVFMDTPGYRSGDRDRPGRGRRQRGLLHHRPRQRVRLQALAVASRSRPTRLCFSAWKRTWTSTAARYRRHRVDRAGRRTALRADPGDCFRQEIEVRGVRLRRGRIRALGAGRDDVTRHPRVLAYALALAALLVLTALAFAVGRFPLGLGDLAALAANKLFGASYAVPPTAETVVMQVRGPRVLAALLVGAALAAAGTAYQGMFRNPLVSPDLLGVSAGAALGAVLGIFFSQSVLVIQLGAFAGGLLAVAVVYAVGANVRRHDPVLALVLTGVVIGTLFGSMIALLKYLADPYNQLPAITFWLLGSLATISPLDLALAAPFALAGLVPLYLLRWRMNLLSLPDDEARALGVPVARLRLAVVCAATLMTAAAVAIRGIIGWVGLLIPHAARLLVGPEFSRLLPLAMLLGAAFLLAVDTLCRTIAAIEVPPGVLTALIGTPLFLWLFALARRSW